MGFQTILIFRDLFEQFINILTTTESTRSWNSVADGTFSQGSQMETFLPAARRHLNLTPPSGSPRSPITSPQQSCTASPRQQGTEGPPVTSWRRHSTYRTSKLLSMLCSIHSSSVLALCVSDERNNDHLCTSLCQMLARGSLTSKASSNNAIGKTLWLGSATACLRRWALKEPALISIYDDLLTPCAVIDCAMLPALIPV